MEDLDEYDQQPMNEDMEPEEEDADEEITQEDAWAVISAYFEEKGLVRQQLDSFDEFIQNTMQEIVDESADIEIRPESQHNPGHQSDFAEVFCIFFTYVCVVLWKKMEILRFFLIFLN
jgi:DNA-directed RNA polymerase II subunit RPB2